MLFINLKYDFFPIFWSLLLPPTDGEAKARVSWFQPSGQGVPTKIENFIVRLICIRYLIVREAKGFGLSQILLSNPRRRIQNRGLE